MAYVSGNPIMSDAEYDKLKIKLKVRYIHHELKTLVYLAVH